MELSRLASRNLTAGQLNAFVHKAGGEEAVRAVLAGNAQVSVQPTTPLLSRDKFSVFIHESEFVPKDWFCTENVVINGYACKLHKWFREQVVVAAKGKSLHFADNGSTIGKGAYRVSYSTLTRSVEPFWLLTALPEAIVFPDVDELLGLMAQLLLRKSEDFTRQQDKDWLFYMKVHNKLWYVTVWECEGIVQFGASKVDFLEKSDGHDTHKKGSMLFLPNSDPSKVLGG